MEKQEQLIPNGRHHVLRMAVAHILNGHGFKKADRQCVETLTEVRSQQLIHSQIVLQL